MTSEQQYIDLYKQNCDTIKAHSSVVMNAVRDEAARLFESAGFPSKKVERYKYTDVAKAFAPDYGVNLARVMTHAAPREAFKCDVPNLNAEVYIIDNDIYVGAGHQESSATDGSSKGQRPDTLYIGSLKRASELYPELVGRYYAKSADASKDSIAALNTMLAQDGLFVYVPRGYRMEKPAQVVNLLQSGVDMMVNRRVLIVMEESSEASLLFCDHAVDKVKFLSTQVMEVYVADNAKLDLYEMEETHTGCTRFSNVYINGQRDSRVTHNNVTLFNGLTRNTVDARLLGQNAEFVLNGCVVADKNQHVDNNTLIEHVAEGCTSRELYKYVVDDQSVGAFAGRILVQKGAQKSVSQETNANLCASTDARMYTQPMLEIYADDVKCAHGSTVGVLDQAALFYMQQRGIDIDEAKMLLKFAFVGQVIDEIRLEPLRDRLHYLVEKRFRGELNKCTGCSMCK